MSTALYTVRCSRLDLAYLPARPKRGLAATFKTFKGTGKKAPFAEHFAKTVKLFSVAEDEAAYAAARAALAANDALAVLRVLEHHHQHGLKREVLEGVDASAAVAAMASSPTVAMRGASLLGQRTLYWAQYFLHRADPTRFVAPSLALVKLVVTTAYSVADSPIPVVPDDQHTLAFRILAQLPAAPGADGPAPITTLTGASTSSLATGKDLRLDPAAFFEELEATKPKSAKDKKTGADVQSATFTLAVLPALARDLAEDASWDTTAWAGR